MRCCVNGSLDPDAVSPPSAAARDFHRALPGYAPTPLRPLPELAAGLGVASVSVKDESSRLGLPAFKVLGASWAVELALQEDAGIHMLVAASAGNHGRAVAHVAARRGLRCSVFLPGRTVAVRREAIAAEGAEVIVVDGTYEDAVARAEETAAGDGALLVADVGDSPAAHAVIDGYATLFDEVAEQSAFDLVLVPVGVGSLAAAAARFAAAAGARLVAVEPVAAACLTASLAAGRPVAVATPGTSMAGLDCAEVSAAAWPDLRAGLAGAVTVDDEETRQAMRLLAAAGLEIGESGAASTAGLHALATDPACADLREAAGLGRGARVLLVATEGPTDPVSWHALFE